jgi:hypothetical protein
MLNLKKHAHWARIAAVALTAAALAAPLVFLLPQLGMFTALLILPVQSLMGAGWISASVASSIFTGISFVGISIINYAATLAVGLGALLAPPIMTAVNNLLRRFAYPETSLEFIPRNYGLRGFASDVAHAARDLFCGVKYACGFRETIEPESASPLKDKLNFSPAAGTLDVQLDSDLSSDDTPAWTPARSITTEPKSPTTEGAPDGQQKERRPTQTI